MNIGAPNSPARWLSENIDTIPDGHTHALIQMQLGTPVLLYSGTPSACMKRMTDSAKQIVCSLDKYR